MAIYREFDNMEKRFVEHFLENAELKLFMEEFLSNYIKGKNYYLALLDLRNYRYKLNETEQENVREFYRDNGNYIIPESIFNNILGMDYKNKPSHTIEQKIRNSYKTYLFKSKNGVSNFIDCFPPMSSLSPSEINCYINLEVFGPDGIVIYSN